MTQSEAILVLNTEYDRQRVRNEAERQRRIDEVSAKEPQIAELITRRHAGLFATLNKACALPGQAEELVAGFTRQLTDTRVALEAALVKHGYAPDYLAPVYRCAVCQDTGAVGDGIRQWCACFRQRMVAMLCADSGMAALESENFDTFDANVYPEEPLPGLDMTQRAYMRTVRDFCQDYADAFPGAQPRNLLFTGASGLGKTFLMNCIAQRVLSRGYTVMRVTASRIVEVARRYHHNGDEADAYARMIDSDLLVIDDLGAEPMIENVTIVYLLNLLNERLNAQRGMVISTNFTPAELTRAYTERVSSRLLDQRTARVIKFMGKDVRLLRA